MTTLQFKGRVFVENLRPRYDDGMWSKERFAERHILFPVREAGYDYLALLLKMAGRLPLEAAELAFDAPAALFSWSGHRRAR